MPTRRAPSFASLADPPNGECFDKLDDEDTLNISDNESVCSSSPEGVPCNTSIDLGPTNQRGSSYRIWVTKYQPSWSCTTKKGRVVTSEAHTLAWKEAVKLQKSLWLSSKHPSFIKQMQHSHVIRLSAALAVPVEFAKRNMPAHDAEVTLDDDESGKSYMVKFLCNERKRFVGGWRAFSNEHKLDIGDVLVFQLLRDCYFKVYTVRVNDLTNEEFAGKKKRRCEASDKEGSRVSRDVDRVEENVERRSSEPDHAGTEILHLSDQDADESDFQNLRKAPQFPSEAIEACSLPALDTGFVKLRNFAEAACLLSGSDDDFEKFRTKVKEIMDPDQICRSTLFSYYQLCCSRKLFLHDNLLKNVSRTMAAEIVKETVQVADAIRSYKLSTSSEDDVSMWTRTLEGFCNLGMDLGFLLDRLEKLVSMASEYHNTLKEQANAPW